MTPGSQVNIKDLRTDDDDDEKQGDKKKSSSSDRKSSRPKSTPTQDRDLRARLSVCFDRIAEALERRGDEELAQIVREDSDVMSQGLVSMTRPLRWFRAPLLLLVAVVEPALAFGRIGRVLATRWADRRAEAQAAAQAAAQ